MVRSTLIVSLLAAIALLVGLIDTGPAEAQKNKLLAKFLFQFGESSTGDGPLEFRNPQGISVSGVQFIVVIDSGNHRVQVLDSDGEYLFEFGSFGTADGEFDNPVDSAVDSKNRIIVLENGNNRVQLFDPKIGFRLAFGSFGIADGLFDS